MKDEKYFFFLLTNNSYDVQVEPSCGKCYVNNNLSFSNYSTQKVISTQSQTLICNAIIKCEMKGGR